MSQTAAGGASPPSGRGKTQACREHLASPQTASPAGPALGHPTARSPPAPAPRGQQAPLAEWGPWGSNVTLWDRDPAPNRAPGLGTAQRGPWSLVRSSLVLGWGPVAQPPEGKQGGKQTAAPDKCSRGDELRLLQAPRGTGPGKAGVGGTQQPRALNWKGGRWSWTEPGLDPSSLRAWGSHSSRR